jgi:hypothetical protein
MTDAFRLKVLYHNVVRKYRELEAILRGTR